MAAYEDHWIWSHRISIPVSKNVLDQCLERVGQALPLNSLASIKTSHWLVLDIPHCEGMYHTIPHIRSPFCNLSASRKCRGGLYAGSDILSREYAPSPGATPRC